MDILYNDLLTIICEYLEFDDIINLYIYLNRDLPNKYIRECVKLLKYKKNNSICTVCDESFISISGRGRKRKYNDGFLCQMCGNIVCRSCHYTSQDFFCAASGKRYLCKKCSLNKNSGFCDKRKSYYSHYHECRK